MQLLTGLVHNKLRTFTYDQPVVGSLLHWSAGSTSTVKQSHNVCNWPQCFPLHCVHCVHTGGSNGAEQCKRLTINNPDSYFLLCACGLNAMHAA